MCISSKSKPSPSNHVMEREFHNSVLLELSASDDLESFKREVEEKDFDVNEAGLWYGRRIGSKKMGYEKRTPLMIASLFGSTRVMKYIIETGRRVDVNMAYGSEKVTALHCAVAGGSETSLEIVKLLLDAGADADCFDANGNKPVNLIPPAFDTFSKSQRKVMEMLLKGREGDQIINQEMEEQKFSVPSFSSKEGTEKKEYPIDVSLPDINNGVYGTDEFRMFIFKVKPCSRAYSHDWTECPFVHPGENARRRDPQKYPYSCVPCPEFRKGTCQKKDACEYAHGVFESLLHPAQYRTRLCKDEISCTRKVCFFAHKPEELRPLYASTGSAMPSPKSFTTGTLDAKVMSPLSLSSSSLPMLTVSTPLMSPLAPASSPNSGSFWQNKTNLTAPSLKLHNKEFSKICDLKPANLNDLLGSVDTSLLSQSHGLSAQPSMPTQMQSPSRLQLHQNMNHLSANYTSNIASSPMRKSSAFGFDSSAVAAAVMNSRSAAFAKRSQSFMDRGVARHHHLGVPSASNPSCRMSSGLSDWTSPNGEVDWSINGDELNRLKKCASFGFRNNGVTTTTLAQSEHPEPDLSWVHSFVKDVSSESSEKQHYDLCKEMLSPWGEQMYMEQEQIVA